MSDAMSEPSANQLATVDKSTAAEAASAHARLNIPLNLDNWRALPEETQHALLWFHQHALDARLTLKEAAEALGYDESTLFRALKGTYEGSWKNVASRIASYQRIVENRGTIQVQAFAENSITRLIFAGLDYALANNSVTLIEGESRMGKSISGQRWRDLNNHGRSVFVIAPAFGGTKALLRSIAAAVGVNKNLSVPQMHEAILRAFNRNRILIVDEAHRLLPGDRRSNPVNLEILRDIHDRTGCALALIATTRFGSELRRSEYMFEQLLGRIGMPVRLRAKIKAADILPILTQYIPKPTEQLVSVCLEIANTLGRLGILVETLRVASRIAAKAKARLAEEHIFKAIAIRRQMQGESETEGGAR